MPPDTLAEFTAAALADIPALLPRFVGNFNRGDRNAKAIVRTLLPLVETNPPTATLATGLRWLRTVDLRPLLARVCCPTLIIQGAKDPLMPAEGARMLAELLPNARLKIMEEAAHTPFLSDPAHFLTLVRSFLS